MHIIRDPSKDKPFELEMGWLCEETSWKFAIVPPEIVNEADQKAKDSLVGSVGSVITGGASPMES
jgi:20S proteasome subunit alpha 7